MVTNEGREIETGKEESKIKNVAFTCPICRTKKIVSIPIKIVSNSDGLTSISFRSGQVCEHMFQAFIDKNFQIRGYQKIDIEVDKDSNIGSPRQSIISEIEAKITGLVNSDHEIIGANLIKMNNYISVSVLPETLDERLINAVSIAFIGLSKQVSKNLFNCSFKKLTLDISSHLLLMTIIEDFVFSVITRKDPNIAMIEIEIEEFKAQILSFIKKI
ncbi:MAG: hypothetical protein JW891_13740 [Candidatus Lokiarchaeota archaeon]|nr:hypothetical protein [Candidatus Lokiarchaeota archaeon]